MLLCRLKKITIVQNTDSLLTHNNARNIENGSENVFPKSIIKGMAEDADADDHTFGVLNEAYAQYYKEGSAAEGVKAIISSGNFFVNGIPVPATRK